MKKSILIITLLAATFLFLSSCQRSIYEMEREAKREAAFNDGYDVGYEEGYWEGISDAQEHLEDVLQDLLLEIEPEEAIQILTNYADGEPITEEELHKAIWAIHQYYWDSYHAINDSDSYN